MTTKAPQVNLKERIAALQQRNVTPPTQRATSTSPVATPNAPPSSANALRDKIAKFEKRGGVPIPRGSFGLGAPPPTENGQPKRRGELYGNRIPSQVTGGSSYKISSHQTGGAFPPSAMNMGGNGLNNRRFSMSQVEMEGNFDDLPSALPPSSTQPEVPKQEQPTARTSFTAERERIQRSVSSSIVLDRPSTSGATPTPIITEAPMVQEPVEEVPAIVVSTVESPTSAAEIRQEAAHVPIISNGATVATVLPEPEEASHTTPQTVSKDEITAAPISDPLPHPIPSSPSVPSTISPAEPIAQAKSAVEPAQTQTSSPPSSSAEPVDRSTKQKVNTPTSPPRTSTQHPKTTYAPEPDFDPFSYVDHNPTKSTFTATVHRKVLESPPRPKSTTTARATIVVSPKADIEKIALPAEMPATPGFGDLAVLMKEAVTLEAILDDVPVSKSSTDVPPAETEMSSTDTKKKVETKNSKSSLRRKRSMGGNSLKKSKSAATAAVAATQVEPPVPPVPISTEPFVPAPLDPRPKRSIARDLVLDGDSPTPISPPTSFVSPDSRKSTIAREASKSTDSIAPTPPPKSPGKSRYFASLRRLGNSSAPSHPPSSAAHATAIPRPSQSLSTHLMTKDDSISSAEDSPAIVTPVDPDSYSMLSHPRESRDGRPSSVYNVSWPVKGKTVSNGILRASSFAEKIWHRTRTRSSASTNGAKLTSPSVHSLAEPTLLPPLQTLEPLESEDSVPATVSPPPRTSSLSPHTSPIAPRGSTAPPPSTFSPPPQLPPLSSGLLDDSSLATSPLLDMSFFDSFSTSGSLTRASS